MTNFTPISLYPKFYLSYPPFNSSHFLSQTQLTGPLASVDRRKCKYSIPMSCYMLRCYSVIQVLSDRQTWGDFSGVVKETGGTERFGENNRKRTNHKHGHTPTLTQHKFQTSGCSSCPRRRQADIFTHQQRLFALRGEI